MPLHPWPRVCALFLSRVREHQERDRCVEHRAAVWYAQAISRMLTVLQAQDVSERQLHEALQRPYDWAIEAIRDCLTDEMWRLVTDKVFVYITLFRPKRQDDPEEIDDVFIRLLNEVFVLTCVGAPQLERVKRLEKLRKEFSEVSFLSPEFAERVGWR